MASYYLHFTIDFALDEKELKRTSILSAYNLSKAASCDNLFECLLGFNSEVRHQHLLGSESLQI